ncbi:hypothetical protein [Kribbella sancticallisti]
MSSGSYVTEQIWHELLHEIGTVRALAAAALEARSEEARLALLTLLDAETAEVSALLEKVDHTTGPRNWNRDEFNSQWAS